MGTEQTLNMFTEIQMTCWLKEEPMIVTINHYQHFLQHLWMDIQDLMPLLFLKTTYLYALARNELHTSQIHSE